MGQAPSACASKAIGFVLPPALPGSSVTFERRLDSAGLAGGQPGA